MAAAAADAPERHDRRRSAAVRELSAIQLVVGRDPRLRCAGLGADPAGDHACRWLRLRVPVRPGVLSAADPLDQHSGGRRPAAGVGGAVRVVPGTLRAGGRHRSAASRLADLVRAAVDGAGMAEVHHPVRRLPVGRGGRRSNVRAVPAAGPTGRRSAALAGDRAHRLRRRRVGDGDRVVVAGVAAAPQADRPPPTMPGSPTPRPPSCCPRSASA